MEKGKDRLNVSVEVIKGIGSKIAGILGKRGIETVEDLLYFLPSGYDDRRNIRNINELAEGEKASVSGTITAYKSLFFRHSRKKAFEAVIEDGTGTLSIKWFQWNRYYLKNICRKGNRLLLSGEVSRFGAQLQMIHPDITIIDDEDEIKNHKTVIPVYTEIEGIKQGTIRNIIKEAFESFGGYVQSVVPGGVEKACGLISLREAFRKLHFPDDDFPDTEYRIPNIERLVFEEYFLFQMALLMKKREVKEGKGIRFKTDGDLYKQFENGLPFELTDAQKLVLGEIKHDMGLNEPMNRLLQGDVGCGKTVCAVLASCIAINNGYQVAFMAPTEILAEQHYLSIHRFFDEMKIPVVLLRGGLGRERKNIIERIRKGDIPAVVGTHALIQKDVAFRKLGLVIIDEQHRFGVVQRKTLKEKGFDERESAKANREVEGFQLKTQATRKRVPRLNTDFTPDTLVMTATPIPRTLSMVIYGDLDVSIIDELPKGRQKIWTKIYLEQNKPAVYRMMEEEVKKGNQVYIVYPLVEESDKMELLNAKEMAVRLQKEIFPTRKIGLLHGRMKPDEKEKIMGRFKAGEIDILVCTTIIEVGIDVPGAAMIVIEHAERFGLSQLHQLRGRVGRGVHSSKCILITSTKRTGVAAKRLRVMEDTTDGFKIAEEDMEIRGPGDMLGVRQAGLPEFRVGNIVKDIDIMIEARKAADQALGMMSNDELDTIMEKAGKRWNDNIHLVDVA
jgi:ATP-dependent DNA helicase RecG